MHKRPCWINMPKLTFTLSSPTNSHPPPAKTSHYQKPTWKVCEDRQPLPAEFRISENRSTSQPDLW